VGVAGVDKHAFFLKEVSDAVALRKRISECFELVRPPVQL
jgi:NADH:ubiquinone reductase (non-electrogenic)